MHGGTESTEKNTSTCFIYKKIGQSSKRSTEKLPDFSVLTATFDLFGRTLKSLPAK